MTTPGAGLTYDEALRAIAARGRFGVRLGLGRTRALLRELGHPELTVRGALVAGTNGKGSVLALAGSALRAAGLRVGETPKPHLVTYRERIQVNGIPISAAAFTRHVRRSHEVAGALEVIREAVRHFERFVRLMVQRELRSNVHRPACEIIRMHLGHRPARRNSHIGVALDFVEILSVGQRRGRQREHEDHNCKRSTDGPVHRAEIPDRCLHHATPYAIRDPLIDRVGTRGMSCVATTFRDPSPKVVAWC